MGWAGLPTGVSSPSFARGRRAGVTGSCSAGAAVASVRAGWPLRAGQCIRPRPGGAHRSSARRYERLRGGSRI